MLLSRLLLLPVAVASTVTVYVHSLSSAADSTPATSSPIPLAQIDYDSTTSTGTLLSYTAPKTSYSPDQLLRIGLSDPKSGAWRGVVTSAASFEEQYKKKFTIHVDERGEPYHVGFGTSARGGGEEVEVEIAKRSVGPKPALNRPIVLNAEGKIESKEPEKSFLQKYAQSSVFYVSIVETALTSLQVLVGYWTLPDGSTRHGWIKGMRSSVELESSTAYSDIQPILQFIHH
jgi:hypothetical protein